MGILSVMASHLDALIGPGVMLLYPLDSQFEPWYLHHGGNLSSMPSYLNWRYASMRAIESPSTLDDQQWLTYWMLYSLITLFEISCWRVLSWFPLWPYIKLVFCLWLVLPIFNGAAYIYENLVRKYIKIGSHVSSSYPAEQRRVLQMMSLDARRSAEKYIERYGPNAFERVIKAAEIEAKKH